MNGLISANGTSQIERILLFFASSSPCVLLFEENAKTQGRKESNFSLNALP